MFHGYGVAPMRVDDRSVVSCSKENSVWKIIPNFSLKEAKSRCLLQFPVHLVLHDLGTNNDPSQLLFYYEIRILESSVSHPVFGIGLAPPYFEEQGMVGWYKHSVGYHADDGYIFASTGPSYTQKAFSKYGQGDCVSVLWYNNEVYFAKNGQLCPHTSSRPFNKFMDFWATITTNMDVSSFQVITEMQHFQHLSRDVFPFLPEKLKRNKCMNRVTIIGGENVEQSPMIEIPTSTLEKSAIITTTQEGDSMASEDEMLLLRLQQDFTNLLSSIKTKNLTTHALQQQVRTLQMEKEQLQKEILTMKESFQQQQDKQRQEHETLKKILEEAQKPEKRVQFSKDELSIIPSTTLQNMKIHMESNLKSIHELQIERASEEVTCAICFSEKKKILFLPCRHLCTCESCANSVSQCPVCRKPIDQKISIHMM